jgi:formylglycine-generating enzyme required for sulfatase activity
VAKIYISSTSEDLREHRRAVIQALRWAQHDVGAMEDYVADNRRPLDKCLEDVAESEIYIGIIAWRYGYVPKEGNPKHQSITECEYRKAVACKKSPLMFLLNDAASWPPRLVDDGQPAKRLKALRQEITKDRTVSFFTNEHDLAERVLAAVAIWERRGEGKRVSTNDDSLPLFELRKPPLKERLPDDPYPLLSPYTHPETFGGRDFEIDELQKLVLKPRLVLCVHAASGAGKSSLLMAGLAPRLRRLSTPVCVVRDLGEPLLAQRLIAGLFDVPDDFELHDDRPLLFRDFAKLMNHAHARAHKPPVLVLDQVDDVLRLSARRDKALARLGPLMAATAQQSGSATDFSCRWVLSYRHEFHGEIDEWLRDVVGPAVDEGYADLKTLPHNLNTSDRLHTWPVPLMGASPRFTGGGHSAEKSFLEAIMKPLKLQSAKGQSRYPITFADRGAERLAAAFASARVKAPNAPLVPEFQVVLRHLLEAAVPNAWRDRVINVPTETDQLQEQIDNALTAHLSGALDRAFPLGHDADTVATARQNRSRALLALRELADAQGRRGRGLTSESLAEAIGPNGEAILDLLASPGMRLIYRDEQDFQPVWMLSHDRLAEIVTKLVDDPRLRRGLDLDRELVELRHFVIQRSDLYVESNDDAALSLTANQHELIQKAQDALLWTSDHRRWWQDAKAWFESMQRIQGNAADAGLRALVDLSRETDSDLERLTTRLAAAGVPARLFWDAFRSVDVEPAGPRIGAEDLLFVVERLYPAFVNDEERFRAMSYAIEEVLHREPQQADRIAPLRGTVREAWRRQHSSGDTRLPPLFRGDCWFLPDETMLGFVEVPRGPFLMGSDKGKDPEAFDDELWPTVEAVRYAAAATTGQGSVDMPTYYVARYPVTVVQFKVFAAKTGLRLGYEGSLAGEPEHPVVHVSWHEALRYCEWLQQELQESTMSPAALKDLLVSGWRVTLPSEPEWEKAARGADGRIYPWDGGLDPTRANYADARIGRTSLVGGFPRGASPYGILDMSGNVWEWTRSLKQKYPYDSTDGRENLGATGERAVRGGSFYLFGKSMRAANRYPYDPESRLSRVGFRVALSRS